MSKSQTRRGPEKTGGARRTLRLGAVLVLVASLGLTACSNSGDGGSKGTNSSRSEGKRLTIGVSLISQQIPILAKITQDFKALGDRYGYDVIITDPNNDASKQIRQVRALIDRHVDALVTGAVNSESFQPVLDEAVKAGIPTVLVGIPPLQQQRGLVTVDFNWYDYGYAVGKAFAECMNDRQGGKGQVGLITTTALGGPVVEDRMKGERDAIKELAPNVDVVAEADGKSDRVKAVQGARTMLRAHGDIVGFTGIGDSEVMGAMQAFREAGGDPKKGCFVGLDGSEEGVKALKDGTLYAEFDPQYSNWMGAAAVILPEMVRNKNSAFYSSKTVLFTPAQASAE